MILEVGEASLWQALRPSQPLDELGSEGCFHLDNEAQEVIVTSTLSVEAMIRFDGLLELSEIFPFIFIHHLAADHVFDFALGRESANAIQRQNRVEALLESLDLEIDALVESRVKY